jgi:hypothetical protein
LVMRSPLLMCQCKMTFCRLPAYRQLVSCWVSGTPTQLQWSEGNWCSGNNYVVSLSKGVAFLHSQQHEMEAEQRGRISDRLAK